MKEGTVSVPHTPLHLLIMKYYLFRGYRNRRDTAAGVKPLLSVQIVIEHFTRARESKTKKMFLKNKRMIDPGFFLNL